MLVFLGQDGHFLGTQLININSELLPIAQNCLRNIWRGTAFRAIEKFLSQIQMNMLLAHVQLFGTFTMDLASKLIKTECADENLKAEQKSAENVHLIVGYYSS